MYLFISKIDGSELIRLSPLNENSESYKIVPNTDKIIFRTSRDTNSDLKFDKEDKLWIGTENGLYLLPNILTKNGLNIKKPNKTLTFSKGDGLIGLDFYRNAIFCDHENQIWMGTGKCLSSINASNFKQTTTKPSVQIDKINITNHYIDFRQKQSNKNELYSYDSTLFTGVKYSRVLEFSNIPSTLTLPFKYNHLTFFFSVQGLNLSSKTTIQSMIEELTHISDDVVSDIGQSKDKAQQSVGAMQSSVELLDAISETSNQINDMATLIATATEQQSNVVADVGRNIEQISEISDKAMNEQINTEQAIRDLANSAQTLDALVATFEKHH